MPLIVTPKLQKALDIASSINEVVSVQAIEPPEHILEQIENKDSVYLDFLIETKSGELNLAIVVPQTVVESVGDSLKFPISDLLSSGCIQIENGAGPISGYSVFDNIGKMTYYVRESDQFLVKLIDKKAPVISTPSENLQKLIDKLKSVNKVKNILVEEIVNEELKETSEKSVVIKAYIDVNNDMVTDHFVSFVATESLCDNEASHKWAVNTLMDLIEKNNAE